MNKLTAVKMIAIETINIAPTKPAMMTPNTFTKIRLSGTDKAAATKAANATAPPTETIRPLPTAQLLRKNRIDKIIIETAGKTNVVQG